MSVLIGDQLNTPLPKPDGVEIVKGRDGQYTVTETYHCDPNQSFDSLPAPGSHHSATYDVPLQTITLKKDGGHHASLTIVWAPDDPNNPSSNIITESPLKELTIGVEMAPLKDIADAYLTADEQADKASDADGKKTKPMHFCIYTYTEYHTVFSFAESNLESGLSLTGNPPGITGPTATKWRFAGRQVRKQGAVTQDAQVWEFRPWLEVA